MDLREIALPVMEGEKVILRPITVEDTPLIIKWRNSPQVMSNFIFRQPLTQEMHESWLREKVASGLVVQYIIVDKAAQKPVGSVYLRDVDAHNHSAEYGLFIGEESARGRGLGSETARLFIKLGFETLKLHRISLRVLEENTASIKSCENAGFVREGFFRDMVKLDGEYKSVIFMAIVSD